VADNPTIAPKTNRIRRIEFFIVASTLRHPSQDPPEEEVERATDEAERIAAEEAARVAVEEAERETAEQKAARDPRYAARKLVRKVTDWMGPACE